MPKDSKSRRDSKLNNLGLDNFRPLLKVLFFESKFNYTKQFIGICIQIFRFDDSSHSIPITVKLQWLKHLWDHENMFETGVVRANGC